MATLSRDGHDLIYRSRYDAGLVAALKQAIPYADRRWDNARKAWVVAACHGQALVALTAQYLDEKITSPAMAAAGVSSEQRLLDIRYIGTCKDRGQDEPTAYGYCDSAWSVIFPESALRAWFEQGSQPGEASTLYGVLGLARDGNAEDLKRAYRRLALQWHPDRCREPDAKEQFQAIQHAYEVLRDASMRAKYDAGLQLASSLNAPRPQGSIATQRAGYRAPLRCGYLLATGRDSLARFIVEKIDAWQDIVREDGKVLSAAWPADADMFVETWL